MSILVLGINHQTAPIAIREKIYFPLDKLSLYLQDLLNRGFTQAAVLLSTCNRSEIYCDTQAVDQLYDWFCSQTTLSQDILAPSLYLYRDEEAVAHMMKVACGLDSMVLGEPQILGQMKTAFSESCAVSAVDTGFHALFQQIFKIAKAIRTTTAIGACPVSVASASVHFVKEKRTQFADDQVLLIGAGDTIELLMRYLAPYLKTQITLINRSLKKAEKIGRGGRILPLEQLEDALRQADVVFSATGSAMPIIDAAKIAKVMATRQQRPMMLIDIAVPRDVEPEVAALEQVSLYCIDDLKFIIENNRQGREHAALKAREMIKQSSQAFMRDRISHENIAHTIRAYRQQIETICREELLKANSQLSQGVNPKEVLESFARAFSKKLMHTPSVQLREAGTQGRLELLRFAKELFAIPDQSVEPT